MRCSCSHPLPLMPKGERFRWEHELLSSMTKGEIVDCRLSLMPTPDCRLSLMPTTDVGSLVSDDDDV